MRTLSKAQLEEMYNRGLTVNEMKDEIEASTGEKISLADIRRLYSILGLDLKKKPLKPRWGLEIDGEVVYEADEVDAPKETPQEELVEEVVEETSNEIQDLNL